MTDSQHIDCLCALAESPLEGSGSVLRALFNGAVNLPWMAVVMWVVSHRTQILKAVEDVRNGADIQTIVDDLLALLKAEVQPS